MPRHWAQFAFIGNRKHIVKLKIPNLTYPNQQSYIKIPNGSREHFIISNNIKAMFNFDTELTDEPLDIVNNKDKSLVKKVIKLGSKEPDAISSANIYDAYNNLNLCEKEHEEGCFKAYH